MQMDYIKLRKQKSHSNNVVSRWNIKHNELFLDDNMYSIITNG